MQTNTMAQLEKRPCLQVNAAAHHALALVQQNQQHPAHVLVGQAGEVILQTHHRGAHVSAGSVHVSATQTSVQQQQQQFPHVLGDQTVGFGPPQQQQLLQQVAVGQAGMVSVRHVGEMIVQAQPHQQQPIPQVTGGCSNNSCFNKLRLVRQGWVAFCGRGRWLVRRGWGWNSSAREILSSLKVIDDTGRRRWR